MLEGLFKSQVLETRDQRLFAMLTSKLQQENIQYSIKVMDLNDRGGMNRATVVTPNTKYMQTNIVYVGKKDEQRALSLLREIREQIAQES